MSRKSTLNDINIPQKNYRLFPFYPVYGATGGFYAMETEFKFDENPTTGQVQLYLKQFRRPDSPNPGYETEFHKLTRKIKKL